MKRRLVLFSLAAVVLAALALTLAAHIGSAHAVKSSSLSSLAQLEHPHASAQANPDNHARLVFHCAVASSATPIVSIQEFVTGDADSGYQDAWAYDTYKRSIEIWSLGNGTYCADLNYDGTFAAIAGAISPGQGSTNILTGNETGHMFGGYVSTLFTGDFAVADPANWPAHGLARPKPINYMCDTSYYCPGDVDWTAKYFTNLSGFDLADWGWRYFAQNPSDGSWTNAASGSSGDII